MKPQIFAIKQMKPLDDGAFEFLSQFIGTEKKQRINNHKIGKERDLMLLGDILSRYAIKKVFGVEFNNIEFEIGEYGKPFLKNYENIHFNISHSGDCVACAVCDVPVGIDIQEITDIDFIPIVNRFYSSIELQSLQNSENALLKFHELWVKKESYLKMIGTGIVRGLDCYEYCGSEIVDCFDGYIMCVSKRE